MENKSPGLSQDTKDKLAVLGGTGLGIGALAILSKIRGVGPAVKAITKATDTVEYDKITTPGILKNELTRIKEKKPILDRKILQKERENLDKIKAVVLDHPLTNGTGQVSDTGGSAIFDFVALYPAKKNLPAEEWGKLFSNNKVLSGEMTANFMKQAGAKPTVRQNIRKEELDDLNIARYDEKGNLIDGFLKFAQDQNATVSKNTLLEMTNNSPLNKVKIRTLETPEETFVDLKEIEKFKKFADENNEGTLIRLSRAYRDADLGNSADPAANELGESLAALIDKASPVSFTNRYNKLAEEMLDAKVELQTHPKKLYGSGQFFNSTSKFIDDKPSSEFLLALKRAKKSYQQLAPENQSAFPEDAVTGLDRIIENEIELAKRTENLKNTIAEESRQSSFPQFGDQTGYRIFAPEEYYEMIPYFPDNSIVRVDVRANKRWSPNHYGDLKGTMPGTQSGMDLPYWARFGLRSTKDGKKTFAVDELQSPQQSIKENVMPGKKVGPVASKVRLSPLNLNFDNRLYKDQIRAAVDEIIELQAKAFRMTPNEAKRVQELERTKKYYEEKLKGGVIDKLMAQPYKKGLSQTELENAMKGREEFAKEAVDRYSVSSAREGIERLYLSDEVAHFMPLLNEDDWADHALKLLLKKAANHPDNVNYISINPVEWEHMLRGNSPGGNVEGIWNFYGTATGKKGLPSQAQVYDAQKRELRPYDGKQKAKETAVLYQVLKDLAKKYNTTVEQIQVAKSDPQKPYKILRRQDSEEIKMYEDTGLKPGDYRTHQAAFETAAERKIYANAKGLDESDFIDMLPVDDNLYYPSYAIKVPENMKELPVKQYKAKGGLVVDIFKW